MIEMLVGEDLEPAIRSRLSPDLGDKAREASRTATPIDFLV